MMQALGQHDAASGMQNVNRVHDAVRAGDEVAPHLSNAARQRQLFYGSTASATLVTMVTGAGLVPSPTPSDALRLPPADRQPDMAGAGAPP